eukprot:m.513266 g.513266  ORF g.513266 m.513266 type:complete len:91 (-) comp21903_c0_seq10:375-647(-)
MLLISFCIRRPVARADALSFAVLVLWVLCCAPWVSTSTSGLWVSAGDVFSRPVSIAAGGRTDDSQWYELLFIAVSTALTLVRIVVGMLEH